VRIHGWTIFAHPPVFNQYEKFLQQVADLRAKAPTDYQKRNASKRLAAIVHLAFDAIPQDLERPEYRLFFQFHAVSKVIMLVWVNNADTKRAYESDADAYWVFKKMLADGQPPGDWEPLLAEARSQSARPH
jgi:toxin YhaV